MSHPQRMRAFPVFLIGLGLLAGQAMAEPLAGGAARKGNEAAVKGRVFGETRPVASATVFAYEVVNTAIRKVQTDRAGHFLFSKLPAGMYQIVAYKQGFAPVTEPLLRRRDDLNQFIELQLKNERVGDVRSGEDYWAVRSRIPADVLREINTLIARNEGLASATHLKNASFAGEMRAHGGIEQLGPGHGEAQLTTAAVDLRGNVGDVRVGLNGTFQQLLPHGGTMPDAQASALALEIAGRQRDSRLSLTAVNSQLAGAGGEALPVDLERYQVGWSGKAGEKGRTGFRAQYTEESNFFQPGWVSLADIPDASRMLNLEGFYSGSFDGHTSLKAGLAYHQLEGEVSSLSQFAKSGDDSSGLSGGLVHEAIDLYGLAGSQIHSGVLVEYGLFSTYRDGSMSLMPYGGMVVNLGSDWQARTSLSQRLEEERPEGVYTGFRSALYSDRTTCQQAGQACYEVSFSRCNERDDEISVGAVHREFAETLRLYFSPDFFNRLESLFFVDGDAVPELQFRMVRKIAPKVLAKLESNYAAGGGGIFYATSELPYENQVRYLVTSLDTQFQQTSTGVFVAFHHLEQALSPVDQKRSAASEMEIQRLQLMLTQDLNILLDAASTWAVRFNLELSSGATPYTLTEDDDLRRKLTGGISVSF